MNPRYRLCACGLLLLCNSLVPTASAAVQQWTAQFGHYALDGAWGATIDAVGNAYVVGTLSPEIPVIGEDFNEAFLAKYDGAGSLVWKSEITGPGFDWAADVVIDRLGNIVVTGTHTNNDNTDAFIAKFDPSGAEMWHQQFGGPTVHDSARSVAVDSAGNVYVSGAATARVGPPTLLDHDGYVRKYSASGALQWSKQFQASSYDFADAVAVDGSDNVYVAGYTIGNIGGPNAGSADVFLIKYNVAGQTQWSRQFGTSSADEYVSLTADALGNVFLAGSTLGNFGGPQAGGGDGFLAKITPAGSIAWARQLASSHVDQAVDVSADGLGNVYVTGRTRGDLYSINSGEFDAFVAKYDADGVLRWGSNFGLGESDYGLGVAADGRGNVYVTGQTLNNLGGPWQGNFDGFITKFTEVPESGGLELAACGIAALLVSSRIRVSSLSGVTASVVAGRLPRCNMRRGIRT